uniref:Putative nibrin n=1 Tax=Amblyomma aureolatum TaxID=187763 RepID=A0A1E1XCK3_9ACAR
MWSLCHPTTNNVCYRLLCGGEFTVGRKNATIIIANDASISREHAVLSVSPLPDEHVGDVSFVPLLRVKDLGSKYGTSVNSKELGKSEETALKEGDTVTFGRLGSAYKICYGAPFVVTTSCLAAPEKECFKTTLKKIGARLKSDWSECCTHVVMSSIRLTMKTTAALLAAKPVVTPAFFTEVLKRVQLQDPTDVDPAGYIPDVSEECLTLSKETFGCNEARRTVFAGKTFYFLAEKQYKSLGGLVSSGGARAKLISPDGLTSDLLAEGSCVIKPADGTETPVCRFLIKNKLRSVSASDVGMAVIHCSTEKFCNPRIRMANVLWGNDLVSTQSQAPSQAEICVPDTELSQQGMAPRRCNISDAPSVSIIVPESRLSSMATSGLGNNPELTLGANTGTTVGGQTRTLLSPFKASPLKNSQSIRESSSPKQPSSPKQSPRKIRKKDATNTLPLECYFGRQSQKRKDDTEGETSAAKARRLNPPSEPDVVEVHVKEEVLLLSSPEPEQREESVNSADEEHHMEAGDAVSFAGTSQFESEPAQRSPNQPQNIEEPSAKPSARSAEALVNGGHDPEYFASKPPAASAEVSVNGDNHLEGLLTETSMVVVEFADLVLRSPQPAAPVRASVSTSGVPNFKRFRKAHQAHLVGLPRIIGGPDLEVYVPAAPGEECDDMEPDSQDISHVFNYEESNKKRRRLV